MRKKLIVMGCVLPLVILITLSSELYSMRVVRQFGAQINAMEQAVLAGEWHQAQTTLDALDTQWAGQCPVIQVWTNHTDTDAVTASLIDLRFALQALDAFESLRYLERLREDVTHLYHRDALTLSNLL